MRIRFLQTTPSEVPDVPFQAGQEIEVPAPSPFLLSLCDGVRADIVKTDETERTVEPEPERSEPLPTKGRRRRARE